MVSPTWALVLDGVTRYPDDGCVHDVPWYVTSLGGALAQQLSVSGENLQAILSAAVRSAADRHRSTCDLENPVSPAATVSIVRKADDRIEWLVLGDCAVVWSAEGDEPHVETDDRLSHLVDPPAPTDVAGIRRYPIEYIAKVRNQPEGFWVASTDADVAKQARVGVLPTSGLRTVGLFSDGLTRLVERYGWTWANVLETGAGQGIPHLLAAIRDAENNDPRLAGRGKRHDDATGVLIA